MRPFWLTSAAALIAGAAHAAPLTYAAALALAELSAPSLQAKARDVDAARAAAVAAGRLPDPKLRLGLDNFPISGPPAGRFGPDSMTMATVGVVQDVPNGAKRRAERARAAAEIGAAQSSQVVEGRDVRLATALAWVDLYYAERRLAALDEVETALKRMRETAPSQLSAGVARPAQTLEADQLLATLGDRRADLTAAVAKARAELARWTGDPAPEAAGAPPDLTVDAVALRAGLERHPQLLAYDALERQADAEVALARAQKRPDVGWDLTYQHRDPMWGDMVSLGATVSLPLFARTRQDPVIAAKTNTASRVRIEREATRRALRAQLDAALADHVMHHDRLMRAQETLVPLARRKSDLERSSYAAGSASLSEVLQALTGLAEAHIDALDREADVVRDAVRINLTYEAAQP
ncbi:TolC family protein [Phenylobacterium soli]|uniref:Transporter n=1 Tax=Phenylobacterium soli TaxID=2170551 RepID=A0A328AMT9_9CAUL|nr:TolC family protein [Phenylobacterium soli]RAK56303.1 transporter [Phenylobacterium soli]